MAVKKTKTVTAREKLASSYNTGTMSTITQVGFGDGGHDADTGEALDTDDTLNQVPGEVLKKAIESSSVTGTVFKAVGLANDTEISLGVDVSSVGFYDSDGDLVAYMNTTPKTMSENMTIEIEWYDEF